MKKIKTFEAFNVQNKPWTWNSNGGWFTYVDGDGISHSTNLEKLNWLKNSNRQVYDFLDHITNQYKRYENFPGEFREDVNIFVERTEK